MHSGSRIVKRCVLKRHKSLELLYSNILRKHNCDNFRPRLERFPTNFWSVCLLNEKDVGLLSLNLRLPYVQIPGEKRNAKKYIKISNETSKLNDIVR